MSNRTEGRLVKRAVRTALLMIFVCVFFTACAPKNAKDLAKQTGLKLLKVSSVSADEDMTFVMTLGTEQINTSFTMDMESTMDLVLDPSQSHIETDLTMEGLGATGSSHMSTYSRKEDDKVYTYTSTDGSAYEKTESPAENYDAGAAMLKSLYDQIADGTIDAQLREGTEEYNGSQVYVMDMTLTGDILEQAADIALTGLGDTPENLKNVEWGKCSVPVTIYVDKKTKLPARMTMDCKELGTAIFEEVAGELGGALINVETFDVEIRFRDYNQIKSIEFPAEIQQ